MHIPLAERLCMPIGELFDMVACYSIINGAKEKRAESCDDDSFLPDLL